MSTKLSIETVEQKVDSILESVLRPGSGIVEDITADEETTEDGEKVLIIDISFAPSEQPLDPDQLVDLPFRVSQQLEAAGEERFCHVRIHFAEKQSLRGW